jgi:hypothetical protein
MMGVDEYKDQFGVTRTYPAGSTVATDGLGNVIISTHDFDPPAGYVKNTKN